MLAGLTARQCVSADGYLPAIIASMAPFARVPGIRFPVEQRAHRPHGEGRVFDGTAERVRSHRMESPVRGTGSRGRAKHRLRSG